MLFDPSDSDRGPDLPKLGRPFNPMKIEEEEPEWTEDAFYGWEPHERQKDFLAIPDTVREGLYGGAAGGGKTDVILVYPTIRGWTDHPLFKGIILRRTLPELDQEIVPRSEQYYKPLGAKYLEGKKTWKFPSGATIRFGYAQHEKDITRYDGGQLCYVAFDELTHFTEAQYIYLVGSRLRSPDSKRLPAVARSATNPGNIGHDWVYKRFVKPAETGYALLVDKRNPKNKRIFIPAKLADNKHADPNYIDTLDLLPKAERDAKKEGSWHSFEGQVFAFRKERQEEEPENACHVIEPFEVPFWWPKVASLDWGFAAKTVFHFGAISPEGRVYVYREYAKAGVEIALWSEQFRQVAIGEDNLKLIRIDPSSKKNLGQRTIFEQFSEHIGSDLSRILDIADNDRVSGKILLQDYLRWTSKPLGHKNHIGEYDPSMADMIFRQYGQDEYRKYVQLFDMPLPEANLPRLQIFNTCTDLISTIPLCMYSKSNKEDVAPFSTDDSYDNIRYLIKAAALYMTDAMQAGKNQDRMEKVRAVLAGANNQTALYRIAEIQEAKARGSFGVRMYQRRRRK